VRKGGVGVSPPFAPTTPRKSTLARRIISFRASECPPLGQRLCSDYAPCPAAFFVRPISRVRAKSPLEPTADGRDPRLARAGWSDSLGAKERTTANAAQQGG